MRHLIHHCYPLRSHGTWQRSVAHLRARWPLFTGRREVSIAIDSNTVDPAEVIDAFGDCDATFWVVENDPKLGEGVSFPALLRSVANESGQTFYCHSKGASHPAGHVSQSWADLMFHLCLDYPELVGATLADYPIAGPCRRVEKRMGVNWHYSGTFFWFNGAFDPPPQPWPRVMNLPATADRNCVERWPAENFSVEIGGDLGLADCRNLYDEINWRSWITRRYQKEILWDAGRRADRARVATKWGELPETSFEPLGVIYRERD